MQPKTQIEVEEMTDEEFVEWLERDDEEAWIDHIHQDPNILVGKPVIKGTRISVELILECAAGGMSEADIVESYPHLTAEGIRAAFAFSIHCVRPTPHMACQGARRAPWLKVVDLSLSLPTRTFPAPRSRDSDWPVTV
jgi:uncharacterized protein (DUF433 family)